MTARNIFKVIFYNRGVVYEVYAKNVSQGGLFGFVEIDTLVFGERTQVVVDPSEESLKTEFKGVRRVHVPIHSIVRIDEVEQEGVSRISPREKGEGTVTPFPSPVLGGPGKGPGDS